MRLLQVINSLGAGGAEKLVAETSILYKKMGIDVDVLLFDDTQSSLYNEVIKNNIKIYSSKKRNIYNPFNILTIKHHLKKYDIVHVHLFPALYWTSISNILSFNNNNIIFTEHNTTNRRRNMIIFKLLDKIIYHQFKKIVSISDAVDSSLKSHLGKSFSKKITKIYNGIDLEKFQNAIPYNKEDLGLISTDKIIIQVSSFTPQKDQKTLIKALRQLPSYIKLLLVGNGPLLEEHEKLAQKYDLNNRIKFLGIRNDVPRLLKSADIIVLASHYEGLSLSCIEGMSSGKPLVASNTPGLGDIVYEAGLVFEDSNTKELSEIINNLITDEQLYHTITKKCLKRSKTFDVNNMVLNYKKLYEDILSKLPRCKHTRH